MKYLLCRDASQLPLFSFSHKHLSKYIYAWYNTFKRTVQNNKFHYLLRTAEKYAIAHCAPWPGTPLSPTWLSWQHRECELVPSLCDIQLFFRVLTSFWLVLEFLMMLKISSGIWMAEDWIFKNGDQVHVPSSLGKMIFFAEFWVSLA